MEVEKDKVERVVTKHGKINTRRHVRKQLSLYGPGYSGYGLTWGMFQDHQGSLHILHPALLVLDLIQPLRGLLPLLAGLCYILVFYRIISW